MRKRLAVPFIAIAMFLATLFPSSASAADCVTVDVVVLGQVVKACVPLSSLPTVTVPGPRVTVNVPGPVRTVTRDVPGPVRTVTNNVSGPTSTVTKTSTARSTVTRNAAGQTVTQGATVTAKPSPDTVEVEVTRPDGSEDTVTVTENQAIGFSLLAVLIGALLALVLLFAAYRLGWLRGEEEGKEFLLELRDTLNPPRKH